MVNENMLLRPRHLSDVTTGLRQFPAVAILGARQVGKTTLARDVAARASGPVHWFDLEDPADAARLAEPGLALRPLKGLVVIDEVQRRPDLFPLLRVLVDRPEAPARFLLLGSAAPDLRRQGAESLAGRLATVVLPGFALDEVGADALQALWVRGGWPGSFLAADDAQSLRWRRAFVSTFLERDLPTLGFGANAVTMLRFWTMLAHWHGQVWNAAEFARAFGVSGHTIRSYVDTLTATYVVRQLQPWHENLSKRQVRAPKTYVADSGLLHALLGLATASDVASHPKVGASFEGFALQEVVARLGARPEECFFWATHGGAELDLLVVRGNLRLGFEFKRSEAPKVTPSMRTALHDLSLDRLDVVHAGTETWPMGDRLRAVALSRVLDDVEVLP